MLKKQLCQALLGLWAIPLSNVLFLRVEHFWKRLLCNTVLKRNELLLYMVPVLCAHLIQDWILLTICFKRDRQREKNRDATECTCFECVNIKEWYPLMLYLLSKTEQNHDIFYHIFPQIKSEKNNPACFFCFSFSGAITVPPCFCICSHLCCFHCAAAQVSAIISWCGVSHHLGPPLLSWL